MVAVCRDHHPEADAGAFALEQLRAFKTIGARGEVGAKINWMRQDLIAVVGGNAYAGVKVAVQINDTPVVWFGRDEADNLLVNVDQLTSTQRRRMQMRNNFWLTEGDDVRDIECPKSGRSVKATYGNGDRISIAFQQHDSWDQFEQRFDGLSRPQARPQWIADQMKASGIEPPPQLLDTVTFPFTTVAISMKIAGTGIDFNSRRSKVEGVTVSGSWAVGPGLSSTSTSVGLQIGLQ
jgi:hypothetical protein